MQREELIALARRCLLPEDAAEAEAIVDILAHTAPITVTRTEDGVLIGAAQASVGHKDPTAAHLDLLLVDPAHRRRGVARELLAGLEPLLKARGLAKVKVTGNAPDYAWPGVDVRYTAAICALEAAGYTHEGTAWNMSAPLPVPGKERTTPEGVEIRRATAGDLEALEAAVGKEWGPAWATEVRRAIEGSGGVHAAWRDDEPIAFAAWGGCRPGWFGPMGTLPSAKSLGLGSVLLRRCLADQAGLGLSKAQIGWVGPVPFYSGAVGAYIERVFFLFSKPL